MKLCSKKILIDTIKPKKNTLHLLCRLTPNNHTVRCGYFYGSLGNFSCSGQVDRLYAG